jgi:glycine oxidase
MTDPTSDVVVVGGGVIGLASAWQLAARGATVTVVDPSPGSGASHVAAGMLCPVTEVHYGEVPLLELNLASARRWPSFAAELCDATGDDIGYRTEGTLAVAFDDDDLRVLDELLAFQRSLGLVAERLRSRECRSIEAHLSPRVRGGVMVAGDHQVDNRRLVRALVHACERVGVRFDRRVATSLDADGVRLGDEVVGADRIVLAAGCGSNALAPEVPVRPVKGQIVRLHHDASDPVLTHNLRGLARGTSVYLVPRRDGELVVGATVEEHGFDTTVTVGGVLDLLRAGADLVPGITELAFAEARAGLRPGTPDNAPVIGASIDRPRVIVATGHFRNGILLTPVTADAVCALVLDGTTPGAVTSFGLERFASCA